MIQLFRILIVVMVAVTMQACFASKKQAEEKVFKNGDDWMPADFHPQKSTLLVQLFNEDVVNSGWRTKFKKWNNEMREYMQEHYPYKYEFVSADEIEYKGVKFSDYQKYPFGLMIGNGSKTLGKSETVTNQSESFMVYDFYFFDRTNGKKYPLTKKYSSNPLITFMPVINTIIEKK